MSLFIAQFIAHRFGSHYHLSVSLFFVCGWLFVWLCGPVMNHDLVPGVILTRLHGLQHTRGNEAVTENKSLDEWLNTVYLHKVHVK